MNKEEKTGKIICKNTKDCFYDNILFYGKYNNLKMASMVGK